MCFKPAYSLTGWHLKQTTNTLLHVAPNLCFRSELRCSGGKWGMLVLWTSCPRNTVAKFTVEHYQFNSSLGGLLLKKINVLIVLELFSKHNLDLSIRPSWSSFKAAECLRVSHSTNSATDVLHFRKMSLKWAGVAWHKGCVTLILWISSDKPSELGQCAYMQSISRKWWNIGQDGF